MEYHYQPSTPSLLSSKYHSPSHQSPKPSKPSHSNSKHHPPSQFSQHQYQDLEKSNYSRVSNRYHDSKENLEYQKKLDSGVLYRTGDEWNSKGRGLRDYNLENDGKRYERGNRGDGEKRNSRNITIEDDRSGFKGYSVHDLSTSQNLTRHPPQPHNTNPTGYLSHKEISSVDKLANTFSSPFKKKMEIENRYEKEQWGSKAKEGNGPRTRGMENYRDYVGSKSSKQLECYPSYYEKEREKENKRECHGYNGYESRFHRVEQGYSPKYEERYQNSPYEKSRFKPKSNTYKDLSHPEQYNRSRGNSYHQYSTQKPYKYDQSQNSSKTKDHFFDSKPLQKSKFDPYKQSTPKAAFTTPALPCSKSYLDLSQFQTSPKLTSIKQFKSTSLIPEKHPLSINDFQLGQSKGEGKFGAVFCAVHKVTGTIYALKRISKEMIRTHNMQSQLALEIKLQIYFNHPNILKLYGFFDDKDNIYLILEYMEQGTLFESLKKRAERIPEKEVIKRIREMSAAIKYLHEVDVAHRDIKPENIVISYGVSKLCDFGWATICNDRRKTYCGTFDYAAPEILEGKEYDWCVDLWCLGVLTYELLIGKVPFYHISRKQTMKKILRVDRDHLAFPTDVSWKAKDFIESLIKKDPEERMLSDKLLDHPFLKADNQGKV